MKIVISDLDSVFTKKAVKFFCSQLNIIPDTIEVCVNDDMTENGMCIDTEEKSFLIVLKKGTRNLGEIYNTLAHEMIHVKQYLTQNLSDFLVKDFDYYDCWWEKEAFIGSLPLLNQFVTTLGVKEHAK